MVGEGGELAIVEPHNSAVVANHPYQQLVRGGNLVSAAVIRTSQIDFAARIESAGNADLRHIGDLLQGSAIVNFDVGYVNVVLADAKIISGPTVFVDPVGHAILVKNDAPSILTLQCPAAEGGGSRNKQPVLEDPVDVIGLEGHAHTAVIRNFCVHGPVGILLAETLLLKSVRLL